MEFPEICAKGGELLATVGMMNSVMESDPTLLPALEGWHNWMDDLGEFLEAKKQEAIEFGSAYDPEV